jgi:hypothetical protein
LTRFWHLDQGHVADHRLAFFQPGDDLDSLGRAQAYRNVNPALHSAALDEDKILVLEGADSGRRQPKYVRAAVDSHQDGGRIAQGQLDRWVVQAKMDGCILRTGSTVG